MDDMGDSLFEGMVLFDPSSQFPLKPSPDSDHKHQHIEDDDDDVEELKSRCEIDQQPPQSPFPAAIATAAGASFEPLDENLFSDLTLIQSRLQDDASSSSSASYVPTTDAATTTLASASHSPITIASTTSNGLTPETQSISRQKSSSRRKKRAGLRIGYGRSADFHDSTIDVEDKHPHPQSSDAISPSPSPSPVAIAVEEKVESGDGEHQILHDSTIESANTSPVEPDVKICEAVPGVVPAGEKIQLEEDADQVHSRQNSDELRYEQIKAHISEKLNHARQAVASLLANRKDLIRKRRKAAEELSLASSKHEEMEKELERAVECEDFETAERVSDSLASAERNNELLSIALRDAEANCDAIDSKMHEVLELQIAAEEECAALLESFAMDAVHNADSVISKAKTMTAEEMEKWLSKSEDLEVKKMEVEIESHVLHEARQVLDDSIEHTVKDDREESELLHKKKEMLTDDLERLLALVKHKEAEIAENDLNIEKVEKRIADTVSGFQDVQANIHSKFENLQSGVSQFEHEKEALSIKKKEIDDFLFKEEARGSKIRELSEVSANEAAMYKELTNLRKSLLQFISKSRQDKARLAVTEKKLSDDVQMLKQDIYAVRASLQDLSSTKSGVQQAIESSKQRLVFIDKRVPELESEKRVAATSRNFKEAARIANEAKTLCVEKESLQTKTEEAMLELKKIEEDINLNVTRLHEKEEEISSMEKKLAKVRYEWLLLVAGTATADRSAAIELGDLEEAGILLKEAQTADSEANELQPTLEEDINGVPKHFIPIELVSTLDKKQLQELAGLLHLDT